MTDEELVFIVLTSKNLSETARQLGRNRQGLSRIACGERLRNVLPDMPRHTGRPSRKKKPAPTCAECLHFTGDFTRPCSLGFPEANTMKYARRSPDSDTQVPSGRVSAAKSCAAYAKSVEHLVDLAAD